MAEREGFVPRIASPFKFHRFLLAKSPENKAFSLEG